MAKISPHIRLYTKEKAEQVNPETLELWKKYKIDMSVRDLSERTIEGYEGDLFQWFIYIMDNQGNVSVKEITDDDITDFIYFCKQEGNNTRRLKRRMSSIAAFYKFLRRKKLIAENPMEYIERPKKDVDVIVQTFLTVEQVELMKQKLQERVNVAQTEKQKDSSLSLQLYALFSLSTMARVNAVSNTRWEQIDFKERIVSDVLEKEGKIVELYFSTEVSVLLRQLKQFRAENGINDMGYIFYSVYDGEIRKITTETLTQWCKKIGDMIDVPSLHAHDFRHSGATLLKDAGMSLEEVSKILNHQNVDVTQKFYIKDNKTQIRQNKDEFEVF
jgi:site-specific recombinase XerD